MKIQLLALLFSSSLVVFANLLSIAPSQAQQCTTSGNDVTCTNSGTLGDNSTVDATANNGGNATFTNSGTIGASSDIATFANGTGIGNATVVNSGTIGTDANIATFANGNGDAVITNSGTIGDGAHLSTFANGSTGNGNASVVNSGTIGAGANVANFANGNGNATVTNSGTVGNNASIAIFANGSGNAIVTNSGMIGSNSTISLYANTGNAIFANSGTASGSVAIHSTSGAADLINKAGSSIAGTIALFGPTKFLEFVGGNYVYTINSLAGVTIESHGAPFVTSGNTVAVFDPTAVGLEDRSLMNFTNGISSMLQDRFSGMGVPGSGTAAPINFAPEMAGDRIGGGHDAFAGMPSLSMSYTSDDSKARNARAMYTKAAATTALPANDITVWTSGFGGERRQSAYDPIQGARDSAYGAVIGIDRQYSPYLRLGVFGGGGNSTLRTDFGVENVDSNYGFGGGYGRYDMRNYFIDFALFGGGISSKSTRSIANNSVPTGLESATARYDGWFISPDVTWGYRFFTAYGTITPKARVRYVGGSFDGYSETGSVQGLTIGKRDISDIEERLGVELASTVPVNIGGTLRTTLEFSGVGLQRLGDNTINGVLFAQNIAFTTPGRREALGGAVTAGLDWRPMNNVSVYVSAEGLGMDDKSYSYVGKAGLRLGF